jgi:hypothetical protein
MCLRAHIFCKDPVIQEAYVDYKAELLKIQEYPNDPEQILLTWRRRNRFNTLRFRYNTCYKRIGQHITITRDSPDSDGSFCILHPLRILIVLIDSICDWSEEQFLGFLYPELIPPHDVEP